MALSFNTGLKNVAISYSKLLNLKITSDTISSAIEEHPFYPSLLSLSDTFENFNCNGFAYKISKDSILNVQCPFIAYVSIPRIGNDFVLIHEINSVSTIYSYNSNKRIKQDSKLFLESFQEIIYIIDSCSAFIEHNYINNLNRNNKAKANEIFWYALVSVVIFSFILLGKPIKFPVYFFTFLIIKIVGLIIAFALISYESNQQNSFIKNICSFGKYTNCQAVLNSKASKIFGVSWAELGLIFFSSSFLFLNISGASTNTL